MRFHKLVGGALGMEALFAALVVAGALAAGPPPRILHVYLPSATVESGQHLKIAMRTSPDAVRAEIHVKTFKFDMARASDDLFSFDYALPGIPWFMKGAYTLDLVAYAKDGASATTQVTIQVK